MKSAWGVNAWGVKQADASVEEIKPGQTECNLCSAGPEAVTFQPCDHRACRACVNKLRAVNIFKVQLRLFILTFILLTANLLLDVAIRIAKVWIVMPQADKGIRCPWCRQFVEGFVSDGGYMSLISSANAYSAYRHVNCNNVS